jgi:hypothetical protein
MKLLKPLMVTLLAVQLSNCTSKLSENYHMDKKYWDVSDYGDAIRQLKYNTPKEEGLPRLSDPVTAPVFNKLVDKQNVSVVLSDDKLGLKHRNEIAQKFFKSANEIENIYRVTDIQDKYVYPVELVRAIEFGLYTQLLYFKLGNDEIINNSLNPEAADVKRIIVSNEETLAHNFNLYIEFLKNENAFNDAALAEYGDMIKTYFGRLLKEFPQADYSNIKSTATLIRNKVKSAGIKDALEDLIKKIDSLNKPSKT